MLPLSTSKTLLICNGLGGKMYRAIRMGCTKGDKTSANYGLYDDVKARVHVGGDLTQVFKCVLVV